MGNITPPIITDTLPVGEIGIRKGQQVHATDGEIGRVQGLVIDRATHHVTHVLLQEGHLWGKKEVAIPIGAVKGIAEGIQTHPHQAGGPGPPGGGRGRPERAT